MSAKLISGSVKTELSHSSTEAALLHYFKKVHNHSGFASYCHLRFQFHAANNQRFVPQTVKITRN